MPTPMLHCSTLTKGGPEPLLILPLPHHMHDSFKTSYSAKCDQLRTVAGFEGALQDADKQV